MKKMFSILTLIFSFISCTIFGQINADLVNTSDLIIEGKVIEQRCIEVTENNNIYTLNTIKVFKIFKGNLSQETITLVTLGGKIDNREQSWSHNFLVGKEYQGLFFLKKDLKPYKQKVFCKKE